MSDTSGGQGHASTPPPGWWQASDGNWYPPQPGSVSGRRTNGLAVASLILGILWMYWVGSILAIIFGIIARRQIDASHGTQDGRGMATAGIILGWVGVGLTAAAIAFVIFLSLLAGAG